VFPYLGNFEKVIPFERITDFYKNIKVWDSQCSPLDAHIYKHRPEEEKYQSQFYGLHNSHQNSLVVTNQDFFSDEWFDLVRAKKHGYVAKIFYTKPGTIEPPHKDFFPSFLNNTNPYDGSPITEDNIEILGKKIIRCWIPLEDSKLGHLLFSDNYCLSKWRKGDVYELPSGNKHGFVNAGSSDRYLLVFTAWRENG